MQAYIQSWLPALPTLNTTPTPKLQFTAPDNAEDDDDELTPTAEEDDDRPPAFPALNSAQRASGPLIPKILTDSQLMPPPPLPRLAVRNPGVPASTSLTIPATMKPPPKLLKRGKVALAPGHSPLDWAALKSSGTDLRGVTALSRIPPSVLKLHNKRDDAWSAFNGKVYNITPYLSFHPGGEPQLMRAAGRDGTKLFAATHAWVNVDFMLDACLVGFLVPEPSS